MKNMRLPAYPLITHDPYFSIWSFSDKLTDRWASHWTGSGTGFCGFIRVDSKTYRFCGDYKGVEAAEQLAVEVTPTRTIYTFKAGSVKLLLSFITPALPYNLDILSRPLTYLSFDIESLDAKAHDCSIYFDVSGEICVDNPGQSVLWGHHKLAGLRLMSFASADQKILARAGDNLRIEWGSAYFAVPDSSDTDCCINLNNTVRGSFASTGKLPDEDCINMPRTPQNGWITMVVAFKLGKVKKASRFMMVAYDDIFSVEYLNRKLPGYWKRNGKSFSSLIKEAASDYEKIKAECVKFDRELFSDCCAAGGKDYADLCAASYRQAVSAHKLVADLDGTPLFFSKENFSNGCIATVDVTYPSAPLFLLAAPALLKGMLIPILEYAETTRWKFNFAPHDLGTYPLANGQVYGGGEDTEDNQMPVEECGNMLILAGTLEILCGDSDFISKYWKTLSKWAAYLKEKGYDPESQLCTDDFAGHLAHNTNLSLKAIIALGVYAEMASKRSMKSEAAAYRKIAASHAKKWLADAFEKDHYKLAFDQKDTWSQKYNLVWDRLLNLGLFPESVAETESAYYAKKLQKYGLPLDSRKTYTKLDWIVWTATLTGKKKDFDTLMNPLYKWIAETPSRVPITDWYETTDGKQVGFQARSVLGGVFIKLLEDKSLIKKWLKHK